MSISLNKTKRPLAWMLAGGVVLGVLLVFQPGVRAAQDVNKPVQEEVTVALKLIQAYVTGKGGEPVTDLTAADFEVTDNGKVVPVTHFEKHILGGDELAAAPAAEVPRLNRRFLLFFDFAFTDARSALRARDAGLRFIDDELKPGDEVGLLSYSSMRGLTIHEYLTTDHSRVRRIVESFGLKSLAGRAESLTSFVYADELRQMLDDISSGPGGAAAVSGGKPAASSGGGAVTSADSFFENLARVQTGGVVDDGRRQSYHDQAMMFSETLGNLALALRYIPGWKNIILFSGGIARSLIYGSRNLTSPVIDPRDPEATAASMRQYDQAQSDSRVREEFTTALKELKTANSPIYAIDCSRPQGEVDIDNPVAASTMSRDLVGKDSLIQLADATGGKYFSNSMDHKNALASIQSMTSAYYVLGYSIPARWDGEFHKVKVRVLRKGLKVASQNGYYNPKSFKEYTRFERLLQMIDLALSDNPLSQIPVEMPLTVMPVMIRGWMYMAAFATMPKAMAREIIGDNGEAYLLIFDEDRGRTSIKNFNVKLPKEDKDVFFPVFILPVAPGSYSCRMVVQNRDSGKGARASAAVVVPEARTTSLWLDPPLLVETNPRGADLGPSEDVSLANIYGFDAATYAPRASSLSAEGGKVLAALRCTLASPGLDLAITATFERAGPPARIAIPVAILNQTQDGSLRTYLLELDEPTLEPGTYSLIILAKEKTGGAGAYCSIPVAVK
jgi:VWFA-related protein